MRRRHLLFAAVVLALVISASACVAMPPSQAPASAPSPQVPESAPSPEPTATAQKKWEDFNPNSFSRSTEVDNPWMPLKPGMRFVYEGTTVQDDGTAVPHRVEVNVTDLTKEIGGVR